MGMVTNWRTGEVSSDEGDGKRLASSVREGIFPFRPLEIKLYLVYDIDNHEYLFSAIAIFRNDLRIRKTIRVNAYLMEEDSDRETDILCEKVVRAFRDSSDVILSPTVHLGDN